MTLKIFWKFLSFMYNYISSKALQNIVSICRVKLTVRERSRNNWNAMFKMYKLTHFVQGQTSRLNARIQYFWQKCSKMPAVTFIGPTQIRIPRRRIDMKSIQASILTDFLGISVAHMQNKASSAWYYISRVFGVFNSANCSVTKELVICRSIFIAIIRKNFFFGWFENTLFWFNILKTSVVF